MFALPATTEIKKSLPKKAIYEKFGLKPAQRDAFDADISLIDIANVVSPSTVPGLKKGERNSLRMLRSRFINTDRQISPGQMPKT